MAWEVGPWKVGTCSNPGIQTYATKRHNRSLQLSRFANDDVRDDHEIVDPGSLLATDPAGAVLWPLPNVSLTFPKLQTWKEFTKMNMAGIVHFDHVQAQRRCPRKDQHASQVLPTRKVVVRRTARTAKIQLPMNPVKAESLVTATRPVEAPQKVFSAVLGKDLL